MGGGGTAGMGAQQGWEHSRDGSTAGMHCGSSKTLTTAQGLHFNGCLWFKEEQGPASWPSGSTKILCIPNTSKVADASRSSESTCYLPHTSSLHCGDNRGHQPGHTPQRPVVPSTQIEKEHAGNSMLGARSSLTRMLFLSTGAHQGHTKA